MNDRLLGVLGGLLALSIAAILLVPPSEPDFTSFPTTEDKEADGLYVFKELLRRSGFSTHSLRGRYDGLLLEVGLAEIGNLLVISIPQRVQPRSEEKDILREWLAAGNTVLFLSAVKDMPDWLGAASTGLMYSESELLSSFGVNFNIGTVEEDNDDSIEKLGDAIDRVMQRQHAAQRVGLIPENNHPLLNNVKRIEIMVAGQREGAVDLLFTEDHRASLVLLRNEENDQPAFWQMRLGAGRIWLSSYSGLFSNHALESRGNAQMIINMASYALADTGAVIFDDMHQGLTDLYDPHAFFADPRLHNTLYFLLALWLLLLIGRSGRLAPYCRKNILASSAQFVRGVGGMFARSLPDRVIAAGLMQHSFNDIRQQYGLPQNGQAVWDILEQAPRVGRVDIDTLKEYSTARGKAINLVHLRNLLLNIRDKML